MDDFLKDLREKRDQARDAALAMAQAENFNPDDEVYRSLVATAEKLNTQVEQVTEQMEAQKRSQAVDARILNLGSGTRGGARVTDEAIYRPDGKRSFFADMWRAQRYRDAESLEMLDRHRALTTATAAGGGGNVVPPSYLADQFAPDPKFGAPVAASWPQYGLPNGPSSFKIPVQATAGTIADHAEGTAVAASDQTFAQIPVTPVVKAGRTVFSRDLLDSASPAIDQIVTADLRGALMEANDKAATTALIATGGALVATSGTDAKTLLSKILSEIPRLYGLRKAPADTIYLSPAAFGYLAAATATDGRPLLNAYNPVNAFGVGDVSQLQTSIGGLPVVIAPQITGETTTYKVILCRRSDFGWFSNPVLEFRYEEKSGPENIEVGVWQYVAPLTNKYPKGVDIITHTF